MKRRIFVALPISTALQAEILEWEKRWKNLPVRWLASKNLHLTLVPPWYEENVDEIIARLESLRDIQKPFVLEFEKVTYGPDLRRPRLIWAEGKTPRELVELKTKTEKVLAQKPDSRPLLLHLTLARFRPEDFSSFPVKRLEEKVCWREEINSLVLMESRLSPLGADYETLVEVTLS